MTVFQLHDEYIFPDPENAEPEGLLAIGGDLSPQRILLAYRMGIFPWYSLGQPILWWSPDPRLIVEPQCLHISKSLKRTLKSNKFSLRFDEQFQQVIENCAMVERRGQDGTWITKEMLEAYLTLHEMGYAHSVETYFEGKLVGGLYGLSMGNAFFGESMFNHQSDA
ncbi:MAG: leucyl/phenylalanyl-tRNA--protein transferase, partial [Proteobacteria bacterium]|nr:leucyl/phenylalanyl-tRNA--protein transferase [Pseudomonadota bacterium]